MARESGAACATSWVFCPLWAARCRYRGTAGYLIGRQVPDRAPEEPPVGADPGMISGRSAIIWSPAPKEAPTVARLASIPHGTTILAQGTASTSATAPSIPNVSIKPFTIGKPSATINFPEQPLAKPSQFRTSGTGLIGITQ